MRKTKRDVSQWIQKPRFVRSAIASGTNT